MIPEIRRNEENNKQSYMYILQYFPSYKYISLTIKNKTKAIATNEFNKTDYLKLLTMIYICIKLNKFIKKECFARKTLKIHDCISITYIIVFY